MKWNSIVEDRIQYYTGKKSLAGLISNYSYLGLRDFNDRKEGQWVLDIGCGDGAQAEKLKDRSSYIGIDRNMDRLEILKKRYPEATAIFGDAAALPFKPYSLDFVFSSNAFEHIWNLKDAVLEVFRCIRPEGSALIVIPTEGGLWNLGRTFLSKPRFTKKYPDIDFDFISHVEHCNEANQVIRTLETFFDVKKKYLPTKLPTIYLNALVQLHCKRKSIDLDLN